MDLQDGALLFGSLALAVGVGLLVAVPWGVVAGIGAGVSVLGSIALHFGAFGIPTTGRRDRKGGG
jgi:hypothetical protein